MSGGRIDGKTVTVTYDDGCRDEHNYQTVRQSTLENVVFGPKYEHTSTVKHRKT